MSEFVRQQEQEPDELEQVQLETVARLQERGINIDRDRLRNVIPSIKFGDLNSSQKQQSTLEYQPDKIIAQVELNGQATVDQVEWSRLNEFKKQHVVLHEAGHRLDWLITSTNNEHWQEIGDIIAEMDPNDISSYLVHLAEKYKESPPEELAKIIRQEALPELIAQFVESDGSFQSFIEVSGLVTDGLEGFEDMDDTAKDDFLNENPVLQFRFHIFVNLREVLHDEKLIESITRNWGGDYEEPFYDDVEMVSNITPPTPKKKVEPVKKPVPLKPQEGYDPFWLFRKD